MKKIALIMAIAALLVSCGTTSGVTSGMSKAERKAYVADQVYNNLNDRHYTIEVNYMSPRRGGMRSVTGGYELTVKGDTVDSYLPYFGDVYRANPYAQQKGLHFTSLIYNYTAGMVKQGEYRIQFQTETDEDRYIYTIQVFDNGKSYIDVYAQDRDGIGFSGEMKIAY